MFKFHGVMSGESSPLYVFFKSEYAGLHGGLPRGRMAWCPSTLEPYDPRYRDDCLFCSHANVLKAASDLLGNHDTQWQDFEPAKRFLHYIIDLRPSIPPELKVFSMGKLLHENLMATLQPRGNDPGAVVTVTRAGSGILTTFSVENGMWGVSAGVRMVQELYARKGEGVLNFLDELHHSGLPPFDMRYFSNEEMHDILYPDEVAKRRFEALTGRS